MKCMSCKTVWKLGANATQTEFKACPFCGSNLKSEEKPDTTTMEGIIRALVLERGESLYENDNAQQFKSLISDYAPKFPKEKIQLGIAIDAGIPEKILKARNSDATEQMATLTICKHNLIDTVGITEAVAIKVINLLAYGLSLDASLDEDSASDEKTEEDIDANMVLLVEGGTFEMIEENSDDDDEYYNYDDSNHSVTVSSFIIWKTLVTQELYEKVIGTNPSYYKGAKRPVECVTWYDAVEFCNALSRKNGLTPCYSKDASDNWTWNQNANGWRLPTEAEWEYAARGGNKSKKYEYSGSNKMDEVAWFYSNSNSETHDVASKKANELGLYDMNGNVLEWCWDWYESYKAGTQTNPTGGKSGSDRVCRGGSWDSIDCKVSTRFSDNPSLCGNNHGFRLVCTPRGSTLVNYVIK